MPPARYRAPGLDALAWRPVLVSSAVTEPELAADPAWARPIDSKALERVEVGGERYGIYASGYGWVGRRPGAAPGERFGRERRAL